MVFDDLQVPETLDVTQLDKIIKKGFKTWESVFLSDELLERKKNTRITPMNEDERGIG